MIPIHEEGFRLTAEGSAAFADMEQNGIRIDVPYLKRMEKEVPEKIAELEEKLKKDDAWKEWQKRFGLGADLGKREQLGHIVFDYFGVKAKRLTKKGAYATDQDAFEGINIPFVKTWNSVDSLKRLLAVNIKGILDETFEEYLRPSLNLHLAVTFRSSCSNPNGQNIPNRVPRMAKIIRPAFIARGDEYRLVEVDFSGAEVRAACGYHHDPTMIKYIEDDHDMHLDMAAECFKLRKDQVSKQIRGVAKRMFVFAAFYGDWYNQICQNLWGAVDLDGLKLNDGTLLRDHLNSVGLTELGNLDPKNVRSGTFEAHIKKVEDNFWNVRFKKYTEWKNEWWNEYLSKGWFATKTGFVSQGVFTRNEVINSPIQGSAFHWLLWVVIELNKWLKERKMRSRLILQIHDSAILDAHESEIQDVLTKVKQLVTVGLREHWHWINVPLAVESSVCRSNWYEKVEYTDQNGIWKEKPKKVAA